MQHSKKAFSGPRNKTGGRSSGRPGKFALSKDQIERPKGSVYQYGKFRSSETSDRGAAQEFLAQLGPKLGQRGGSSRGDSRGGSRGYDRRGPAHSGPSHGAHHGGSGRVGEGAFDARAVYGESGSGAPQSRSHTGHVPARTHTRSSFASRDGGRGGFSNRGSYASHGGPSAYGAPAGYGSRGGFGNRSGMGGGRGGFGGGKKKKGRDESIDPTRFINKTNPDAKVDAATAEAHAAAQKITHTFMDFKMDDRLKRAVVAKGYTEPSPIQDRSIPVILEGRDVVGIANTGTGKTAAFLLPLIDKILQNKKEQVIIVAPTRELALQIDQEFKDLSRGLGLFSVCCVGGVSIVGQLKELRYFNNFIIGTPGRLKDLIERGQIKLENFSTIVLDEADQMLDMGFINDMKYLVAKMPKVRHTLFFSATLSPEIERLIGDFLNDPVRISVKTRDTSKDVEQDVVRVTPGMNKFDALKNLLTQPGFDKVIVFCRTKHGAEKLGKVLMREGIQAESIHGDKDHKRRQKALKLFKDHHVQVLVATDVAARGLDISGVSHVINYDLPATYTDYVHRIGRTGRGGKKGMALTFIESQS